MTGEVGETMVEKRYSHRGVLDDEVERVRMLMRRMDRSCWEGNIHSQSVK